MAMHQMKWFMGSQASTPNVVLPAEIDGAQGVIDPGTASVTLSFSGTGTWSGSPAVDFNQSSGTWLPEGASASAYQFMLETSTGALTAGDSAGVWYDGDSFRAFTVTQSPPVGVQQWTGTLRFRDKATLEARGSCPVSLTAEVQSNN